MSEHSDPLPGGLLTTLFVDASWCPEARVGGWGAWAKNDRMARGIKYRGAFRELLRSSNEAELLGAANALACCLRDKVVLPGDRVLFQVDNQHALRVITGEGQPAPGLEMLGRKFFRAKASELGLVYFAKHVKGHSGEEDTRSDVNRCVDGLARGMMEQLRAHVSTGRAVGDFFRKESAGQI